MADYWTENLAEAAIEAGDVLVQFPIAERDVAGGRAWARRRYPFRSGQSDEDTGGDPRVISYTVPLFRGVDEEDYPNGLLAIIDLFEGDAHLGRALLTDPELGGLSVRLVSYAWRTDAKAREGGILSIQFETLDEELYLPPMASERRAADTKAPGMLVDEALAEAGVSPVTTATVFRDAGLPLTGTELVVLGLSASFAANVGLVAGVIAAAAQQPPPSAFTTSVTASSGFGPTTVEDDEVLLVSALAVRLEAHIRDGVIRGADEVGAAVDTFLGRVAALREHVSTLEASVAYPALLACGRLMTEMRRVAEGSLDDSPLVVDYEVRGEQSAVEVAVELFGEPARAQEIIDLNPTLSPDFFQAGTMLAVPLE